MGETLSSIMNSRRSMSAEIRNTNDYLKIALDNMARGVSMFDDKQRLILCNKKYGEIYGVPEQLTRPGTPLSAIIRWYIKCESGRDVAIDVSGQLEWIRKEVAILAEGKLRVRTQKLYNGRIVRITTQPLASGGWVDVQEDITERGESAAKGGSPSQLDPLTELPNRSSFQKEVEGALKEGGDGISFAVHVIEVASFQPVRERLGFAVRDSMIQELGKTIRTSVTSDSFAARIDGDVFAVMRKVAMGEEAAHDAGRSLVAALARPCHVYGHSIVPDLRVHTVFAPRDGRTTKQIVNSALTSRRETESG